MIGIYKLTSPSGKSYIGQSVDIDRRMNKYRNANCKTQYGIYNAILKYGFDSFKLDIIHEIADSDSMIDVLNKLEESEIRLQNTMYPNGYNMVGGGDNRFASEKHKENLSKSHKGKKMLPQTAEALRRANTGRKMSNELKCKLKEISSNRIRTKEERESISIKKKGVKLSEEHKMKVSAALKGRKLPERLRYIKAKEVYKLDMDYNFIEKFRSLSDAAASINTMPKRISACFTGTRGSHKGFRWVSKEYFDGLFK
jgi:group I intron endonuclease